MDISTPGAAFVSWWWGREGRRSRLLAVPALAPVSEPEQRGRELKGIWGIALGSLPERLPVAF